MSSARVPPQAHEWGLGYAWGYACLAPIADIPRDEIPEEIDPYEDE